MAARGIMAPMQHNHERRWHPLLNEWVILSAKTANRPWSGDKVKRSAVTVPEFDEKCYLCPGVKRASGELNPRYTKTFAFTNDFSSFSADAPETRSDDFFSRHEPAKGICRVVCFSPKHNITLAEMQTPEILDVIALWKEEYRRLSADKMIKNVLIFENKGASVGTSNPHPHGQIYATGFVPEIVKQELDAQVEYRKKYNSSLLIDLVRNELKVKDRLICRNDHFAAFIPYFARFAFETYIVPLRKVSRIVDLTSEETRSFAEIFHAMLIKFDNLYNMSFPNITMFHNAPTDNDPRNDEFVFHVEFYPPMRTPDTLKYLAGFESGGGNIINPVMPEVAAEQLRKAADKHSESVR